MKMSVKQQQHIMVLHINRPYRGLGMYLKDARIARSASIKDIILIQARAIQARVHNAGVRENVYANGQVLRRPRLHNHNPV